MSDIPPLPSEPVPVDFDAALAKRLPPLAPMPADAPPPAASPPAAPTNPHVPVLALLALALLVAVMAFVLVLSGHASDVPQWFPYFGFACLGGAGVAVPSRWVA